MKKIITLLLFTVFLMGCDGATETAVPTAEPSNQTNAEIVLDALAQVVDAQNVSLIADYYHDDYIEHAPDGQATIEATIEEMIAKEGTVERTVARVIEEGDLVAVHSLVQIKVGDSVRSSMVFADVFRVVDGKIAEHWQVRQQEVRQSLSANGNSMIDGDGDPSKNVSEADLERNKQTVIDFFEKGFAGDHEVLDSLFGEEYIQHNPNVPNGKEAVLGFVQSAGISVEVKQIMAQGDLVFSLNHYPGARMAIMDIFRLDENGKVVEHWDVAQQISPDIAHENGVFGEGE